MRFWIMSDDLAPAIAVFERIIADAERRVADARRSIDALLQAQGLEPRYAEEAMAARAGGVVALSGSGFLSARAAPIKRDSFYGKKQMTAIRELLEMRRSHGDGPATPREIFDALKAGGYRFDAKTDDIALVGLRASLRKATTVFHKLPGTNAYGLTAWYPDAKAARTTDAAQSRPSKSATKTRGPKASGAKTKATRAKRLGKPKRRAAAAPKSPVLAFVEAALADGSEWTLERLLEEARSRQIEGVSAATKRTTFNALLMTLKQHNRAVSLGNGIWKGASSSEPPPGADDRVVPMKGVA
jgi:hypothetical protein